MSQRITITLAPEAHQVKMLLDTMREYSDLCNYISSKVHERGQIRPTNLYYWKTHPFYSNFYEEVRANFPDLNSNWIPLAFRKVAKAYKSKMPCNPHKFNGIIDYNKYLLTIKVALPAQSNIDMISISTLAGRQHMRFLFDDTQRKAVSTAFASNKYCEYKLIYQGDTFLLSTNI